MHNQHIFYHQAVIMNLNLSFR